MSRTQWSRLATLGGWFGLFGLMILWFAWLAPPEHYPVSLAVLFMAGPLLFPLRGLLHGKPYTHAWTSFLALAYFTHGSVEAWVNAAERHFALLEVLLSLLLFTGAIFYARFRARELKAESAAAEVDEASRGH